MKLELGMYVRTEWGTIQKIKEYRNYCKSREDEEEVYYLNINQSYQEFEKIIKASHSLLGDDKEDGIIEVGDYVNGSKVNIIENEFIYFDTGHSIHYEYIETIVTKEQFEAMQYEVVE